MSCVNRRTSFFPYLSITQAGITVLLAGVVLISLNGLFGITLLLQKQAAAAHALLLSTQDFKTSILRRDGAASSKKKGKRNHHLEWVKLAPLQFSQILLNPLSIKGRGASRNELNLKKRWKEKICYNAPHIRKAPVDVQSIFCPLPFSLSSPLRKKTNKQGALGGASKLHSLSLGGSLESSDPTRPQPRSPCLSASRRGPERQPIACRDHFRSWKLDQSKRSVLKRPVRIQDVCAHALLVAGGDFFLCSGPLWYLAEPEDYAGPDSPRSEWKRPRREPGRAERLEDPEVKVAPGHPARLRLPGRLHS